MVPVTVTRPTLRIGETLNEEDDEASESDENFSPDAEKSEIRFTLERKQSRGDKNNAANNNNNDGNNNANTNTNSNNSRDDNKSNGDGTDGSRKNRDNNQNGGGNRGRGRFRDSNNNNGNGNRNGGDGDNGNNGFGGGGTRGGGGGGFGGGGGGFGSGGRGFGGGGGGNGGFRGGGGGGGNNRFGNNGGNNNDDNNNDDNGNGFGRGRGGNGGGDGNRGSNDRNDGNNGGNNGGGDGGGDAGGNGDENNGSENDRGGADPDSDNNSSTPNPPSPPPTTSTTSPDDTSTTTPVEEPATTLLEEPINTPVQEPTIVPAPEAPEPTPTVDSGLTLLTPVCLPALSPWSYTNARQMPVIADPSPVEQPVELIPTITVVPELESPLDAGSQITASVLPTVTTDPGTPETTQTRTAGNNDNQNDKNDFRFGGFGGFGGFGNRRPEANGLNATSERILVAAGSIGGFIVLCFVGFMVYRTLKKSKQSGRTSSNAEWFSMFLPRCMRGRSALRGARTANSSHESKEFKEPSLAYDGGNFNPMQVAGYYDREKPSQIGSSGSTYPSTGNLLDDKMAIWQTPGVQPTLANDQTMASSESSSTMQSRMLDPYQHQPQLARQPSAAYHPGQRQVYRASEISSLSSGFGDGDIIMPPPTVIPKTLPSPPQPPIDTDPGHRQFSWISRSEGKPPLPPQQQQQQQQKRDTVYTTASEQPTRFRSITSWVDQQKTRIKRADSSVFRKAPETAYR